LQINAKTLGFKYGDRILVYVCTNADECWMIHIDRDGVGNELFRRFINSDLN
jgi:hypothetical protein